MCMMPLEMTQFQSSSSRHLMGQGPAIKESTGLQTKLQFSQFKINQSFDIKHHRRQPVIITPQTSLITALPSLIKPSAQSNNNNNINSTSNTTKTRRVRFELPPQDDAAPPNNRSKTTAPATTSTSNIRTLATATSTTTTSSNSNRTRTTRTRSRSPTRAGRANKSGNGRNNSVSSHPNAIVSNHAWSSISSSRRRDAADATSPHRTPTTNCNNTATYCGGPIIGRASSSSSAIGDVVVTASPGARRRVHPTGRYTRGTLSPTIAIEGLAAASAAAVAVSPGGRALVGAARDGDDHLLKDLLRRAVLVGIGDEELNAIDSSGRTALSYIASNGSTELTEQILQLLPHLDYNKADNEGNTPLHFAAQAGQVECLNCLLTRCRGIEIDARNNLGFTPLMKAALQGRNKCAKLLLFAGANPTLRDNGRGFRADQWARFCGRYVCADVIEKHARQRLLERSTSYGNWGGDIEIGTRVLMGKVMPVAPIAQPASHGLKSKLRKVFRTSSGHGRTDDAFSSARLVTQLTSAALCASSPVLPSAPSVPPVVKSLLRPLTVPKLQITLVNNNAGDHPNNNLIQQQQHQQQQQQQNSHQAKPAKVKNKNNNKK